VGDRQNISHSSTTKKNTAGQANEKLPSRTSYGKTTNQHQNKK